MSITIIPVQENFSAWSQRTNLDGVDYQLDFAWNGLAGAWYLSISDTQGVPFVTGLKLVSNRPLLKRFHFIAGMPPGEIYAADPSGTISYAGFTDLNRSVDVVYFDAAELADIAANGP
jgi:hypothetical protein